MTWTPEHDRRIARRNEAAYELVGAVHAIVENHGGYTREFIIESLTKYFRKYEIAASAFDELDKQEAKENG